jgi:hypothetical protein
MAEKPCVYLLKQKVPRPYSGAEDGAPSLTGARDDDLFDKDRSTRPLIYPFSPKAGVNGALKTRDSLTPFEMTFCK